MTQIQAQIVRDVITQAKSAWMHGNASDFASLFAIDGEMIVPGKKWRGQEQIHNALTEFASSHISVNIEIRRILIDGNTATIEWLWEETDQQTGKTSPAEDAIVVDFQGNGLIQRWREYIDSNSPSNN